MEKVLAGSQHHQWSETEENWSTYGTALSVLGKPSRKHQDCFEDSNKKVKALLDVGNNARVKYLWLDTRPNTTGQN